MSRIVSINLFFVVVLFIHPIRTMSQCDPKLTPSDNPITHYRQRGDKCEGTLRLLVSTPRVSLVNLTKGRLHYLNREDTITLKSENIGYEKVNVRAVPISLAVYYRMDGVLAWGKTLHWKVSEVLFPIGLGSQNVGVFGWVGDEKDKTYVALNCTDEQDEIHLILRASSEVFDLKWRYAKLDQGIPQSFSNYLQIGNFQANRPIDIVLNRSFKSGTYLIEVTSKVSGSNAPLVAEFKIVLP